MNTIFIIGTGRNGSKLLANCLGTGDNVSVFGEVGEDGPQPAWYKEIFHGIGNLNDRMKKFKIMRQERFKISKYVYIEKNHLLGPILHKFPEIFPEARYIYLKRNSKQTIRSFYARRWYGPKDLGEYGDGRLSPKDTKEWDELGTFEKCCWLYFKYSQFCVNFTNQIAQEHLEVVKYSELGNPETYEHLFRFCGIEGFNDFKIKNAIEKIYGTPTRESEPIAKDWSKKQKKIYKAYKKAYDNEFESS